MLLKLIYDSNISAQSRIHIFLTYCKSCCLDIQYIYASSEEIQKVKNEGRFQELEAKGMRLRYVTTV